MKKNKGKILWHASYFSCQGDWLEIVLRFFVQLFCDHNVLRWNHNCFAEDGGCLFKSVWMCERCQQRLLRDGIRA